MTIQLYGLLHLNDKQLSAVNLKTKDFMEQISIYVSNAITLSNTLKSHGVSFTLLTNEIKVIRDCVKSMQGELLVQDIPFTTEVPNGVRFYSAHFKLDAFRYLATLNIAYVGLCDLDMICINNYSICLQNIVSAKIPLYYDISDQVIPAYGQEVIINDLKLIHGIDSEGRWYGGEFIAGTPAFFAELVETIDSIYPNYLSNISVLHHIGDEAFTTAALELLRRNGGCFADAGTLGIVGRFWNENVLHFQKPFDYYKQCFLLHLPADKRLLADLANQKEVVADDFLKMYAAYIKKSLLTKIINKIHRIKNSVLLKS